jgi:hypothetical protein
MFETLNNHEQHVGKSTSLGPNIKLPCCPDEGYPGCGKTLPCCHSERSEESRSAHFHEHTRFFVACGSSE